MMAYNTRNYWGFGLFPLSSILEIQFPKCRVFWSLAYWTMTKVQKPSNSLLHLIRPSHIILGERCITLAFGNLLCHMSILIIINKNEKHLHFISQVINF
jgi:hypothetical protein